MRDFSEFNTFKLHAKNFTMNKNDNYYVMRISFS